MFNDRLGDRILILDFGSQYTQLIARRVRELGVYCEIFPYDVDVELIKTFSPRGIILSGGPETVTLDITPRAPQIIFTLNCPILGICYGQQTMAAQLGGQVAEHLKREYGYARVKVQQQNHLLLNIEDHVENGNAYLDVWMSHGDRVTELPKGFITLGSSEHSPHAIIADESRHYYGVQFHPEVTHTHQGQRILARFVHDICGCQQNWTAENIIASQIKKIQEKVKNEQVILALSGGVDSSVVAAILNQAIGQQLICIFVDTGLLRLNEGDQVMDLFAKHLGVRVIRVDAKHQFYHALQGINNPEQKRKIIGEQFIRIFEHQARKLKNIRWLAQGTIYPDVIESAQAQSENKAQVIKSHHNVGGLPEKMNLSLIEPIRELFKDEVRKIGIELGLPSELIERHPFPGPGLAVRILGEIKPEYIEILQQADAIFLEELHQAGWYSRVSQAFAVFLPVKSVGVKGDARCYDYVIALRAVTTTDFMTAHWSELPHSLLSKISHRIINEVPHISRVVYDISGKPPATIEWE